MSRVKPGRGTMDVRYTEFYSRHALEDPLYEPCKDCPPEYRAAYARLQGLVEGADALFEMAYEAFHELYRMNNLGA